MAFDNAGPDNHCPCGCTAADLDEHGYCRHLVGFSNDGKTYEALVRGARGLRQIQCMKFDAGSGRYQRIVHKILKGDQLINPEVPQLVDTIWHQAKKWVSARVYRANVPQERLAEEIVSTEEVIEETTENAAQAVA